MILFVFFPGAGDSLILSFTKYFISPGHLYLLCSFSACQKIHVQSMCVRTCFLSFWFWELRLIEFCILVAMIKCFPVEMKPKDLRALCRSAKSVSLRKAGTPFYLYVKLKYILVSIFRDFLAKSPIYILALSNFS